MGFPVEGGERQQGLRGDQELDEAELRIGHGGLQELPAPGDNRKENLLHLECENGPEARLFAEQPRMLAVQADDGGKSAARFYMLAEASLENQVPDHGVRGKLNRTQGAHAVCDIDIFAGGQGKAFIKAADFHQKRSAVRHVASPVKTAMGIIDEMIQDGMCVRSRQGFAFHPGQRGIVQERLDQVLKPLCLGNAIAVQKSDNIRGSQPDTVIAGLGRAAIRLSHDLHPGQRQAFLLSAGDIRRLIAGAVIDQDNLEPLRRKCLIPQSLQAFFDIARCVVGGYDDRGIHIGAIITYNGGMDERTGEKRTAAYFDRQSSGWSERYRGNRHFQTRLRTVLDWIRHESPNLELLDYGCGSGVLLKVLAEGGHAMTGVDISGDMLREAEADLRTVLDAEFTLEHIREDSRGEYLKKSYDGIVSLGVLEYVENPWRTLETLVSCLKPGGFLIISVPNRDSVLRKLEGAIFRNRMVFGRFGLFPHLTGPDAYLQYQRHQFSRRELEAFGERMDLNLQNVEFHVAPGWIGPLEHTGAFGMSVIVLMRRLRLSQDFG